MNNNTPLRITFEAFLRKVKEVLVRHALRGIRALIAVLRALRERGIWPWHRSVKAEAVCTQVAQAVAVPEAAEKKPDTEKKTASEKPAATKERTSYGTQVKDTTQRMKDFLLDHYDLRYNMVDSTPELRPKAAADAPYVQMGNVQLNTIVVRLHEHGIPAWDRDVTRLLQSLAMPQHHPLAHYLQHLPQWDGTDRLTPLARRVADDALWVRVFSTWMRAMVMQWRECTAAPAATEGQRHVSNQLAPILISRQQGLHKSTFCRMLLPQELQMYFTDKFELEARANLDYPLCRHALVNLDEFDRYSATQLTRLKNLMQLGQLNVRRPHARHFELMHRTASFIGTSNTSELLIDPTGSRRFYCQEVDHLIDCSTPPDHAQLYAQLLAEIEAGLPVYLDKTDEAALQRHNRRYYKASPLREAFLQLYTPAAEADTSTAASAAGEAEAEARWLSATEIYHTLQQHFGTHLLAGSPSQLGRQLTFLETPKRHTERGTLYRVARAGVSA